MIAAQPYVPSDMRWWRFRPDVAHSAIAAETSPDGKQWNPLGRVSHAVPGRVSVLLLAGNPASAAGAIGSAAFRNFNICP